MSFSELPAELIGLICENCSMKQIKALRLTCQSLRNVADGYLFPRIVTVMTRDSMDTARLIAENSRFCKGPTALGFQGDRLRPLEFESWKAKVAKESRSEAQRAKEEHLELSRRISMGQARSLEPHEEARWQFLESIADARFRPHYSDSELRDRFNHYHNLALEGTQIITDGTVQRCMQTAFEKCPRLRALDFTLANEIFRQTHRGMETFRRGLVIPFGDMDPYQEGLKAMIAIILAAADAQFSPQTLRMGRVTSHLVNRADLSEAMPQFLANVENLEWFLSGPHFDNVPMINSSETRKFMTNFREGHFLKFMESTVNLRTLVIEVPWAQDGDGRRADLSNVVGSVSWPHLRGFTISGLSAGSTSLANFLLRHAGTLECLEMNDIQLHEEWSDCFPRFAGKLPRLKEVRLGGFFVEQVNNFFATFDYAMGRSTKYSRKVAKYITQGGKEFPPPPVDGEGERMLDVPIDEETTSDNEAPSDVAGA
ncbi:hypothetical protein CERZMDRAFT_98175 [Cercospora zeae-maydis SCOH1-5]|uniref:Uncharacterized protein n=1 Tax=Cercospora zeae-maydis SCOH1-5 TaxID=717836 RepID=A0A6A6FEC1_9PEZI|nr:hypothetical protein CERZMDRAFT_98175 [Cercospora zeae-maydis SCOH1-5]